jgi:hypothetical protein
LHPASLTPESSFVCRALERGPSPAAHPASAKIAPRDLPTLARTLDWRACLESTAPTLWPMLQRALAERLPAGAVPEWAAERLADATRASALLHLQRPSELRRRLAALDREGVPVIVLKGMAIATTLYGDPALRPMVDIDLLVRGSDAARARDVLRAVGLRIPERWQVRPATGPAAKDEDEKPWERPGTPILVELHDRLEWTRAPFAYDIDAAWARSVTARLGPDLDARVLGPADTLLHLSMHLSSYHGFEHGLRDLLDVTLLVERHAFDWTALAADWARQGTAGWMRLTLVLARDLLGAPVPDALVAALPRPDATDAALALALERLWSAPLDQVPPALVTVLDSGGAEHALARLNPVRPDDGLGAVLRRVVVDVKTRVPRYVAALTGGHLGPRSIRRAVALRRAQRRLSELMAPTEAAARAPVE